MTALRKDEGVSFVEVVMALALIVVLASLAAPVTAQAIDAGRARHATGFVAARMRMARLQAVANGGSAGLVFDLSEHRWTFRVCLDGNGNGLRRADIAEGRDTCPEGPYDLAHMFPGMAVAVDPRLPGPEGDAYSSDPVRFGVSNMASFSPEGTATAGTLFLKSTRGVQYAVRVGNVTGRTRILRYDRGAGAWLAG